MPKISVILPVYNVEKYIAKSIQSVLDQSLHDFELLIIIDGSPDNSKSIAESFSDARIRIFEKDNGGLSDARNFGLERANGKYIYFMDSDDWIEDDLLQTCFDVLEQENRDFVVFGFKQDNESAEGEIISSFLKTPKSIVLIKQTQNIVLEENELTILGYAWNKVYRKSFLDAHNFKFEKGVSLVEDILFNALIYKTSDEIRFINFTPYHYINRQIPTLIKKFHENSFELNLWKIKRLEVFFKEWKIKNEKEILAYALVLGIRYCVHNLFCFDNQLSFSQKRTYVKGMLVNKKTQQLITFYKASSKTDEIYKFLIKNKLSYTLTILAKLIK